MLRQDIEGAVNVVDEVEATEQRLVAADASEATARHAVDDEGRDADAVELLAPVGNVAAWAAGTVHQDHCRQPAGPLGDA